jgi:L-malate glycosyltransferase
MQYSMKTIFIHLLNDYSGSTKVLSDIVDFHKDKEMSFVLMHGRNGNGFLNDKSEDKNLFFYKRSNIRLLTLVYYFFSQVILFFKMFKYYRINCVIYVNTMLSFGAALAGKIMGKDVIFHVHETSLKPVTLKIFLKFIIKYTAKKIIYVSNYLKEEEPIKNVTSRVIYNSLSPSFIEKSNNYSNRYEQNVAFNVTMACSLKEYKGVNEFLKVANICSSKKHIKFILILNAETDEIESYFSNVEKPSNITFYPKQSDLAPFYENSSLVLNLSRVDQWIETFGLTILEAMTFGIPVIAPPVGGPKEIVRNKVDGYLISSYDINEIAKKIILLSSDINQYRKMSISSRERSKDFDPAIFQNSIVNFIES